MLKRGSIKKQVLKEWHKLFAVLMIFYKHQKPEALHRFRVEIKKIRAILFFDPNTKKNKKLAHSFEPLKTVFKEAGEIRSLQINYQLLQKFHVHPMGHIAEQKELITKNSRRFLLRIPIHLKKIESIEKMLFKEIKSYENKKLFHLFSEKIHSINTTLQKKKYKSESLHSARKQVKELLYMYTCLTKSIRKKLILNNSYLNTLQELMGNWHDVETASKFLKNNKLSNSTYSQKLEQQNQELIKDIRKMSKNFLKKINTTV